MIEEKEISFWYFSSPYRAFVLKILPTFILIGYELCNKNVTNYLLISEI